MLFSPSEPCDLLVPGQFFCEAARMPLHYSLLASVPILCLIVPTTPPHGRFPFPTGMNEMRKVDFVGCQFGLNFDGQVTVANKTKQAFPPCSILHLRRKRTGIFMYFHDIVHIWFILLPMFCCMALWHHSKLNTANAFFSCINSYYGGHFGSLLSVALSKQFSPHCHHHETCCLLPRTISLPALPFSHLLCCDCLLTFSVLLLLMSLSPVSIPSASSVLFSSCLHFWAVGDACQAGWAPSGASMRGMVAPSMIDSDWCVYLLALLTQKLAWWWCVLFHYTPLLVGQAWQTQHFLFFCLPCTHPPYCSPHSLQLCLFVKQDRKDKKARDKRREEKEEQGVACFALCAQHASFLKIFLLYTPPPPFLRAPLMS